MSSPLMVSVSGCRGIVGESLTPEVVARFAGSYAGVLSARSGGKPPTMVLGRDGRRGCEAVHHAAVAGLIGAGCRVVDLGVAMTPTVAVMTDAASRGEVGSVPGGGVVGGMVLTASHNPQEWNGLKCLLADGGEWGSAACARPADITDRIIAAFRGGGAPWRGWREVGHVVRDETGVETHVERLMDAIEAEGLCEMASSLGDGLRVAVDSVNASGVEGARVALESLGCDEILHLGSEASGVFHHPPEPTSENLSAPGGLCDAVREGGMDVGFAQDPDADRLAIIDEQGRYVGEEYTLALSALALLSARERAGVRGGTLVTNLSTSRMLDDVAARFGAGVVRTPVGEAHVVSAMKASGGGGVVCGGEGNGGTIWPRVAYVRDSIGAMALVLWLMSPRGARPGQTTRVSDLVASLPRYAIVKRKVDLAGREEAAPAIGKIAKAYGAQRVDVRDGAWVDFTSGPLAGRAWLHVRASNTEPIMRLIAEAPTPAQANALLDEAALAIG